MSDSLQPHGLQPTRLLRPWDSPGKSNGVGCHRPLPEGLEHPILVLEQEPHGSDESSISDSKAVSDGDDER